MTNPEFVARIVATERLNNSVNGNPRFRIAFDNGALRTTQSDSSVSYEVENYTNRRYAGMVFAVHTSRAGRVTYLVPETEARR